MFNFNYNFMVHLKVFEIVKSKKIYHSKRDFKLVIDLVEELEFFVRMVATKWQLVINFD